VVVFCEGKATEPDYVNELKRLPHIRQNTALLVDVSPDHGTPMTLVAKAIDRLQDREVDECWCLFDVEWPQNHPKLKEALTLAAAHGVSVAVSNPCFELWLILHFRDHHSFDDTATVERTSRQLDGRSGKRIDASQYMTRRGVAADRARKLDARHASVRTTFPNDNPSSGMYRFLDAIEPTVDITGQDAADW